MAKLTTRYDRELKEKVFVLRGEEAYARTTDCLLDEILHDPSESGIDPNTGRRIDWNNTIGYMLLEFRLDVLRDIGASYVVLYDNDEMLGVYDFDTNTHSIEFVYNENPDLDTRLKLAYGVEHNLYAKYMGNKQCLKSESKKYNFNEPVPSHFESSLSFDSLGLILPDTPITINVTLTATHGTDNQTIYLYDGSTLIGTASTVNGVATFSNITFTTNGKHTLTARYNGSDQLYACSTNYDVSVGYILTITDYPSYVVNNSPATITVSAVDYLDRPVGGKNIFIANDVAWEPLSQEVTTNNEGVAVFNQVGMMDEPYYAKCSGDSPNIYKSESVTTNIFDNATVSITASDPIVPSGSLTSFYGNVSNVNAPVKVTLDNGIGEVTTDNTGYYSANYTTTGKGDTTVTASIYGSNASITFEDVVGYLSIRNKSNYMPYTLDTGYFTSLTNGWKCGGNYIGRFAMFFKSPDSSSKYELRFKIISIDGTLSTFGWKDDTVDASSFSTGDNIRVVFDFSRITMSVYRNESLVRSILYHYGVGLTFQWSTTNNGIIIDELVCKRLG